MGWFFKTRQGHEWKQPESRQGWHARALESASAPPAQLIAILCIVVLFLSMSNHTDHGSYDYRKNTRVNLFLIITPVIFIVIALLIAKVGSFKNNYRRGYGGDLVTKAREGSPWVVAAVVILMLVMVSYHHV